jgi:nitrile hydratase accessory protein
LNWLDASRRVPRAESRTGEDPVFREPWEAHAFALALLLHERGLFSWQEWAGALAAQIKAAPMSADADLGDTYYRHWLDALEILIAEKGLSCAGELASYRQAWERAAGRTPHGQAIELRPADFPAIRTEP